MQVLPRPRGPRSHALIELFGRRAGRSGSRPSGVQDPLADDDLQLALYLCYELHYRGVEGRSLMEWDPACSRSAPAGGAVRACVTPIDNLFIGDRSVTETLQAMAAAESRPSLSATSPGRPAHASSPSSSCTALSTR